MGVDADEAVDSHGSRHGWQRTKPTVGSCLHSVNRGG
jgi:hypothetical protein